MAKIPEHLRLMLERCKAEHQLVLTASCGCEVGTVIYQSKEMSYVDVCRDHKDELLGAAEFVEKVEDPPLPPKRRREGMN